jgi:phospholipase C
MPVPIRLPDSLDTPERARISSARPVPRSEGGPIVRRWLVAAVFLLVAVTLVAVERSPVRAGPAATKIQHVVIISKENRSFDHYFGKLPGVNGATKATLSTGEVVDLAAAMDSLPPPGDIDHNNAAFNVAFDGGRMDGFDLEGRAYANNGYPSALSQMSESQIPSYWAYAKRYGIGDRNFSDWKGVSYCNNLMLVAGQCGEYDGNIDNRFTFDFPHGPNNENLTLWWGCDDPVGSTVKMQNYLTGVKDKLYPCFDFEGLPNVLSDNGLSWKVYTDETSNSNVHNSADSLTPIRNDPLLWANVVDIDLFTQDAATGALPNVSWIYARESEHPPLSACAGENETVTALNAVMNGPAWNSTAVFIVWDEWGGFYDHVPPPQIDRISYGIRTPLLVISPWTRRGALAGGGFVSHKLSSHTSVLKFVSDNWALPYLTPHIADPALSNLMDYFNFSPPTPPKGPLIRNVRTCQALTPEQQWIADNLEDPG